MLIHCSSIVVVIFIQMKARDADDKTGLLITLYSFEDVVYLVEIRKKNDLLSVYGDGVIDCKSHHDEFVFWVSPLS